MGTYQYKKWAFAFWIETHLHKIPQATKAREIRGLQSFSDLNGGGDPRPCKSTSPPVHIEGIICPISSLFTSFLFFRHSSSFVIFR